MNDYCRTFKAGEFTVQENGIVRNDKGTIVGRLDDIILLSDRLEAAKSGIQLILSKAENWESNFLGSDEWINKDYPKIKAILQDKDNEI